MQSPNLAITAPDRQLLEQGAVSPDGDERIVRDLTRTVEPQNGKAGGS